MVLRPIATTLGLWFCLLLYRQYSYSITVHYSLLEENTGHRDRGVARSGGGDDIDNTDRPTNRNQQRHRQATTKDEDCNNSHKSKSNNATKKSNEEEVGRRLSLAELTRNPREGTIHCPPLMVPIYDRILPSQPQHDTTHSPPTRRKIPKLLHISYKSRCVPAEVYGDGIQQWKDTLDDHALYFHDDTAIALFFEQAWIHDVFPALHKLLEHCILFRGAMTIDIWRMLILYQFGGWYTDIDNVPAKEFQNQNNQNKTSTLLPNDTFFSVVANKQRVSKRSGRPSKDPKKINQNVFAMTPHHPIAYYTIQRILYNLEHMVDNIQRVKVVQTTGPSAFYDGYHDYFRMTYQQLSTEQKQQHWWRFENTTTQHQQNKKKKKQRRRGNKTTNTNATTTTTADTTTKNKYDYSNKLYDEPGIYFGLGNLQIHKEEYWNWKNMVGDETIVVVTSTTTNKTTTMNKKEYANWIGNTPHWTKRKDKKKDSSNNTLWNHRTTHRTANTDSSNNDSDTNNNRSLEYLQHQVRYGKKRISCKEYLFRLQHPETIQTTMAEVNEDLDDDHDTDNRDDKNNSNAYEVYQQRKRKKQEHIQKLFLTTKNTNTAMTTRQQQHNTVENTTTANTHKNTPAVRSSDDDANEDNEDNSDSDDDNSDDGDNDKDDDDDVTQEM